MGVMPVEFHIRPQEVPGRFAVCRLPHGSVVPSWVAASCIYSIIQTLDELTIVCQAEVVPAGVMCEQPWRCVRVAGSMPFSVTGVLAGITQPLAAAGVSVFAFSTYDTDYLLVQEANWERATEAWGEAGLW
jgi:nitrilase